MTQALITICLCGAAVTCFDASADVFALAEQTIEDLEAKIARLVHSRVASQRVVSCCVSDLR